MNLWTTIPRGVLELRPAIEYRVTTFKIVKKRAITDLDTALDLLEKGYTLTCIACKCVIGEYDKGRKFKLEDGVLYHHNPHTDEPPDQGGWWAERGRTTRAIFEIWFETRHVFEVD